MGVKSTKDITRNEAEARLLAHLFLVRSMSDDALCDLLARLNDLVAGGEGFENYRIVAEHHSG